MVIHIMEQTFPIQTLRLDTSHMLVLWTGLEMWNTGGGLGRRGTRIQSILSFSQPFSKHICIYAILWAWPTQLGFSSRLLLIPIQSPQLYLLDCCLVYILICAYCVTQCVDTTIDHKNVECSIAKLSLSPSSTKLDWVSCIFEISKTRLVTSIFRQLEENLRFFSSGLWLIISKLSISF